MYKITLFVFSCFVFQHVSSQYVSFQQPAPLNVNICSSPSSTSLVEHFFNLIFSEFHNHPPVCVCVQMCPDQPTYCYPNGCFKKAEPTTKKNDAMPTKYQRTGQVSQLQQDNAKPMSFLVDGQNSFTENLLTSKPFESKQGSKYDDGNSYKEMHRDPFKDRYQSIFKYKKTPKVHLRYNLREQVRHKKSDVIKIEKIDVTKTKWPVTVNNNKQFYSDKEKKDSKYFHNLESISSHYPSKFFKRDVAKLFKPKEANFEEIENATDTSSFSLENLIENLIESSFGPLANDTELDLNVNLDYATDLNSSVDYTIENNETTVEPITMPYKRSPDMNALMNKNTMIILNETTNIVSINNTNQNIDENTYRDDDRKEEIYKNVFKEMIASLSRNIEKNNNSSIEMMEQALGNRIEEISSNIEITDSTTEASFKDDIQPIATNAVDINVDTATCKMTTETSEGTITIEKESTATEKDIEREHTGRMRKSHRRILRKSQNNKPN